MLLREGEIKMPTIVKGYPKQKTRISEKERDDMILEYLPLVKFIAARLSNKLPSHIELDDLENSGIIGLIDAIDKFDPTRKIKFKTYAEFRIKGAMLDELRSLDWVPRSTRQKATRLEKAYSDLEKQLGRPASDDEIVDHLGITFDAFHKMINEAKGIALISIDELYSENNSDSLDRNLLDFVATPESLDPALIVYLDQIYNIVADAIDQLPEKEKLVISLYYYDELTMKEISEILSITESRVSQIHTKSIIRLRSKLVPILGNEEL